MEIFGYRKLVVYIKAREMVRQVYKLLKNFPKEEQFAMCDQLRRASVSVTSNIAEGVNRYSVKEKAHFLEMSYSSLMEVMSQLEIANDLGYISNVDLNNIEVVVADIARLLSGLQRSYKSKSENEEE
jgi:four helix bundle protein